MKEADELPAAPDAQFLVDIGDMVLDRVDRDEGLLLDLSVALAPENELENIAFP